MPDGVRSCDAAEIFPHDQIFQRRSGFGAGGYAEFSDRFRYHLLYAKGGWWFDMDFAAVRLLPEPTDLRSASTWEFEHGQCAMGAAMWCKPGDPRVAELARRADEIFARHEEFAFGATGPFLVQSLVAERSLQQNVAPWWEFCPFPWRMQNRMAYQNNMDWAKDRVRHVLQLRSSVPGQTSVPAIFAREPAPCIGTTKSGRRAAKQRRPLSPLVAVRSPDASPWRERGPSGVRTSMLQKTIGAAGAITGSLAKELRMSEKRALQIARNCPCRTEVVLQD